MQFGEFWTADGWDDNGRDADLEQAACTECGANVWRTRRGPYVAEYDTGVVCGYYSYGCYFAHRHRNNLEEIAGEQSVSLPCTDHCENRVSELPPGQSRTSQF